jgi:hypothetical protein
MTRRRCIEAACILTLLVTAPGLPAGPAVALVGVSGGLGASAEALEDSDTAALLILTGSFSTRQALAGGGYFNLLSSASCLLADLRDPVDQEDLQLKLSLPAGPHRLEVEAGWSSSLSGNPVTLSPNWRLGFVRHSAASASELELSSAGAWEYQPRDREDVFWQEIRAGLKRRPSLRLHWETSAGFGYEHWGESFLVTPAGLELPDTRRDLLVDLRTTLGGLWGYFADWSLGLDVVYISSTANRYLASAFDEDSESRIAVSAGGDLSWSPRHDISVQLSSFAAPAFYLFREARAEDRSLTGAKLATLTWGGSLRADWTPDHRLYLVLAGEAGRTCSNDPAEEQWALSASGGLEISY